MTKLPRVVIALVVLLFGHSPPLADEPKTPGLEFVSETAGTPENDFGVGDFDASRRQTAQMPDSSAGHNWTFMVTPFAWIPNSVEGTSTVGMAPPVELDFDLSDIIDHLDFSASTRVEAWKGRFGLILEANYVDLGGEVKTPGADIDVDIKQANVDFLVGYEVARIPIGAGDGKHPRTKRRDVSLHLLGGLRYAYLEQDIKFDPGSSFGGSGWWVEPVVGAQVMVGLSDKWTATVRGDASGFGINDDVSNLTWNALVGFDYRAWENTSIKFGYRIYDIDYETGSGADTLGLDAQMMGPWLGVTMYYN